MNLKKWLMCKFNVFKVLMIVFCSFSNSSYSQKNDKDFLLRHSIDIHPNSIPFNKKGKWGVALLDGKILIKPKYDSLLNAGKNICIAYTEKKGYQLLTGESKELLSTTAKNIRFLETGIFEITNKTNEINFAIWNGVTLQMANNETAIKLAKSKNDFWNDQIIYPNLEELNKYVYSIHIFEDSGVKFFNCKLKNGTHLSLEKLSTIKFISPSYIQGFDKIRGIGYLLDLSGGMTYSVENDLFESPLKKDNDLFFIKRTSTGYNLIKNNVPTSYFSQNPIELKNGMIIKTIKDLNFNSSSIKMYNIDDYNAIPGTFDFILKYGSVLAFYTKNKNVTLYSKEGYLIKSILNKDVIGCEYYEIDSIPIMKVISGKSLEEAPIKLNDVIEKELPKKTNRSDEYTRVAEYFDPRFESLISKSGKVLLEVHGSIIPYSSNSSLFQLDQINGESFIYYIDTIKDSAIQLKYNDIIQLSDSLCFVKSDNKYSLMQINNQEVKPVLFDNVLTLGIGEHRVVICNIEGKKSYFDENMKSLNFDQDVNLSILASDISNTEPYYLKYSNKDLLFGVLDSEGKVLIQAKYKSILYRKSANYFVCLLPNSEFEYLLPNGKQIVID
ncbi:MAG: WG repeat-containing protein [Fluviicola sp.]|nr:WG repeat-containing protein [Fluviicola sp.]